VRGAREAVTGPLDATEVLARRDYFTDDWKDGSGERWVAGAGLDLFRGRGRLAGERRVVVTREGSPVAGLVARHAVVVATGTTAAVPPIPGLAEASPWISRDATSAQAAPPRLGILGGGVVGCEMATAWNQLGSRVTLIQRGDRLIPALEPFASDALKAGLEAGGVRVLTGTSAAAVHRAGAGPVSVDLTTGEALECDQLLVATGRRPATTDLGLESVGLEPGSWLDVDETMRVTAVPAGWLYAAGDVNHRVLLTHMGKYQARVCGDVIAARARGEGPEGDPAPWSRFAATADHAVVPQVIFTDPEIGAVGLSEREAATRGLRVRAVDFDISDVSGAGLFADDYRGHARLVVDEDRRVPVGLTMVGMGVGEMVHAATIAIAGEVPLERLWHAVPSFPTLSEVWLRLLEAYGL